MSKKSKSDEKKLSYRIPTDAGWANAWKIAAVLGGIGAVACALGAMNDPHRFAFSWLFAFMAFLALGLGGLFITIMLNLTAASWGVTVRRTAEMLAIGLPVFAILWVPIAFSTQELYPWATHHGDDHAEEADEHGEDGHGEDGHGEDGHEHEEGEEHGLLDFGSPTTVHAQETRDPEDLHPDERVDHAHAAPEGEGDHAEHGEHHDPEHAIHAEIIESKLGYLNEAFFWGRGIFYLLAWIVMAFLFFSWSTRQDKEKGLALTNKLQNAAPAATIVLGLTSTFAAFDWMMSTEPSWFSTIFGVQYFAVCAVSSFSMVILLTMGLRRAGILGDAVNVEHYHDVGKLLHGFIVFHAYITFSQFILIWYAGIPEEATYYHLRWWGGGGFQNISILLILGHFIIPFLGLMSRNAKRTLPVLAFFCAWILVFHIVEVYWLVMPYAEQTGLVETTLRVHWMDLAALFAVGGIYMSTVLFMMTRHPLIPVGDPRLARSLAWEQ
ncbi:MAG: hypothetical protein AB8I08_21830 [Sandaracinaceae bacterium]